MSDGEFRIVISGDDQTAAADESAKKGMRGVVKEADRTSRRIGSTMDKTGKSMSGGMLKSMATIESASIRVFSGSGGLIARISQVAQVGSTMSRGMGEAAESGGLLSGTLGRLGVIAGGTVAVLAGVAIATDKLVTGWAKGVANAAQLADTIGISTKALQEFQAAGERVGVDKDSAGGSLGGLASILYNARYGRGDVGGVMGLLAAARIQMRYDAEGNPDSMAMLPDIADAMRRQTPQGRLHMAQVLGISPNAIPLFSQGGAALQADMTDAGRYAAVATPGEIARAREWRRKRVRAGQMADRALLRAGDYAADAAMPALDAANGLGARMIGGGGALAQFSRDVPSAARKMDQAGDKMLEAAGGGPRGAGNEGDLASRIRYRGERSRQDQVSPRGAVGVMQLLPTTARRVARHFGIPWDPHRFRTDEDYNSMLGQLELRRLDGIYHNEILDAIGYNAGEGVLSPRGYLDRHGRHHRSWLQRFGDPRTGEISPEEFVRRIPYPETRNYVERVTGVGHEHVHHHRHHIEISRRGVRVTTRTDGKSGQSMISHAFDNPLN